MKGGSGGEPVVVCSGGGASGAFWYVSDAIRAIWYVLLLDANGEVFNVGNDEQEISISGLAEQMREIAGPPWLEIERRGGAGGDYVAENTQRPRPGMRELR